MNKNEPDWSLYRSFLAVLREGSLSGAARSLAVTQPTIARHIEALEQGVGFELFTRSQQGLSPTDGAIELQPYAESLAATSAAMMRTASGHGRTVKGTVRISASEIVGAEVLPPILSAIRAQHPELEFELVLSNAVENLLRRDADIAVRMFEPAQDALVVRRMGTVTLGLHAHKRYLARSGKPRSAEELRNHTLIGVDTETPAIRALRKSTPGFEDIQFAFRTNSDVAQLMAIRAGFGIGVCQVRVAAREPDIERILPKAFGIKLGVWIAMHENLRTTRRCRVVFDGLVAGLKAHVD